MSQVEEKKLQVFDFQIKATELDSEKGETELKINVAAHCSSEFAKSAVTAFLTKHREFIPVFMEASFIAISEKGDESEKSEEPQPSAE